MLKRSANRAFLYRYLLSFVILLFIPLILLSYLVKNRAFNLLREEILQNNLGTLKSVVSLADKDMEAMEQIVIQLSLTPVIYKEKTVRDVIELWECASILKTLVISSGSFRSIAVSWENLPYVYANSGSCTLALLSADDPLYPDFSKPEALRVARARRNPIVGEEAGLLLFTWPVRFAGNVPPARISFLVEAGRYQGQPSAARQEDAPRYWVYHRNALLTGNVDAAPFSQEAIQAWRDLRAPYTGILELDGEKTLICAMRAANPDFFFVSSTPLSKAMANANALQREFVLYTVVCLLATAAIIYASLRLNYRPLHRLFVSVEHLLQGNQKRLSEISSIEQAVDNLKRSNARLLSYSQQTAVNSVMTKLLRGVYSPQNPLPMEELAAVDFHAAHAWHMICIVKIHQAGAVLLTPDALGRIVREFFPACLVREAAEPVVLINLDQEPQRLPGQLERLRLAIAQYFESEVTLSAGNPCEDVYDIPTSYMEAVYSLDYRFIRGNNSLILASDVGIQEEWMEHYPHQDMALLRRMLNTRRLSTLEQIVRQFDSILEYVRTCEVPMFAARMICFEVINIVLSSMNDEELRHNKEYIAHLSRFNTAEEMLASLSQICHNLLNLSEPDTARVSQDLILQMKVYVESNYTDNNFSLQDMADFFHMGMANLSQFFKRQTGQTLIGYYTGLRMELAKTLLTEGSYKMDRIAAMVGYLNTSSFIRRFKQYTGLSPGQWLSSEEEKG